MILRLAQLKQMIFLQLLIEDTVQCIRMSALCNGKWICLAQSPIPHKEPPPSKFLTLKNNFSNKKNFSHPPERTSFPEKKFRTLA